MPRERQDEIVWLCGLHGFVGVVDDARALESFSLECFESKLRDNRSI